MRQNRSIHLLPFLLLSVLLVPGVGAHAFISTSEPADGDRLEALPPEVVLRYTEGVQQATVRVLDQNNQRVDTGQAIIGRPDNSIVTVPLREDAGGDGIYTLRWQVLADDGHITSGSFFWLVGDAEPDRETLLALFAGSEDDGAAFHPMEAALRGILLVAVVALIGIPLAHRFVLRPAVRNTPHEHTALSQGETRSKRILLGATAILLLGANGLAFLRIHNAYGQINTASITDFAGTALGTTWILQSLAAVSALLLLALAPVRFRLPAALIAGIIAGWTISSGSHSATLMSGPLGFFVDLGHVAGASLWAGGLIALVLVSGPIASGLPEPWRGHVAAGLIARFSILALLGLGLAITSGFLMAAWHIPHAGALWTTLYGATLMTKLALILGALALGSTMRLYVLRRLRPDDTPTRTSAAQVGPATTIASIAAVANMPGSEKRERRTGISLFHRIAGTEALLLVLVLLASGLMTTAPTGVAAAHEGPDLGPPLITQSVGTMDVTLSIIPARVGLNVIDVHVTNEDGSAVDARDMLLLLRHPREDVAIDPIEAEHIEGAHWSAVGAISLGGVWSLRVQFWTDAGFHAPRFHFPMPTPDTVQRLNEAAAPPPVAEVGPFQQLAWAAAALAALVAIIALVTEAGRTSRRSVPPPPQ